MTNVIKLDLFTKNDIDSQYMLRNIADSDPENVFVICWPKDGTMPTYHSSTNDTSVVLLRIQEFIHRFYNGDFK